MINEQMSLLAFLNNCKNDTVSQSEMYIFIKQHTNNFDKTAFEYLRNDLNLSVCNIKFNIYIETKNLNIDNLFEFETPNGSIYCYESPRTISSYIKEVFPEIDYFLNASTPRQKIQFVINDIEEKGLNREIFEDDYLGFLKFSDMVETEYKRVTESTPNEIETTLNEINRPNNRVMNYKEITFNEFCDKCIEGSVSNIDMINYIEIISNKFDISYMQCLFQDMNLYIEKLGFEDKSNLKERYYTLYSFFCILDKKWNHSLDKRIEEAINDRNKTVPPPKQPLTFAGLFKPEYRDRLTVLFDRLKLNGFTDENNNWLIKNGTNEPAKLFHYLKDKNVIITLKFAPAIKCFYKEFGCEVVEKDNGNPRATTRVNAQEAKNSVDESAFNQFVLSWINKK